MPLVDVLTIAACAGLSASCVTAHMLRRRRAVAGTRVCDVTAGLDPDDVAELAAIAVAVLAEELCPPGADIEVSALCARAVPVSRVEQLSLRESAVVFADGSWLVLTAPESARLFDVARLDRPTLETVSACADGLMLTFRSRRRSVRVPVRAAEVR